MKEKFFQNGQTWRIITLILCIAMLVVMLIPGVCPNEVHYLNSSVFYDSGTYLNPNSWSGFYCWGAFAANCFCLISCFLGSLTKTNTPVQAVLSQLVTLVFIGLVFYYDQPLQYWADGYFLPIVPPVLAVGVMIASVLAFFRDKKTQ